MGQFVELELADESPNLCYAWVVVAGMVGGWSFGDFHAAELVHGNSAVRFARPLRGVENWSSERKKNQQPDYEQYR